jgi:hypothetical protein
LYQTVVDGAEFNEADAVLALLVEAGGRWTTTKFGKYLLHFPK